MHISFDQTIPFWKLNPEMFVCMCEMIYTYEFFVKPNVAKNLNGDQQENE